MQVCAAQGKLPGQNNRNIIFARAPASLDPKGNKPFGECRGWRPGGVGGDCKRTGYATDDIFFLEVCMFNQSAPTRHARVRTRSPSCAVPLPKASSVAKTPLPR